MGSQGTNSAIEEYDSFIYDHDLFNYNGSVFRGGIPDQDEPSSEYELKSVEFKAHPENHNILSSKKKYYHFYLESKLKQNIKIQKKIISLMVSKKKKNQKKKIKKMYILLPLSIKIEEKQKNYLQKIKEKDRIQKRIQIILKTKLSHIS